MHLFLFVDCIDGFKKVRNYLGRKLYKIKKLSKVSERISKYFDIDIFF